MLDMVQPFADFDWVLVDKYLSDDRYASWYRESTNIKFVDNSVTEKGEPCSLDDLQKVFDDCKATYVIAPDWIGDHQRTIEGYKECISKFPKEKVVGALQGPTPRHALQCLDVYEGITVAVPYRVGGSKKGDPNWLMSMRRVIVVAHIPAGRQVHLLGFTDLAELRWYSYFNYAHVVSIDTDVPVRAGLVEADIDEFDRSQDVSGVKMDQNRWSGVCRNIALMRQAMS